MPSPDSPTSEAPEPPAADVIRPRAGRLRKLYMTLRTEHTAPGKVALAVGLGTTLACLPLWGVHLALAVTLAAVFRVNKMLVYAASNLSNPVTVPFLVVFQVQVGNRILQGDWLTLAQAREAGLAGISAAFLMGALVSMLLLPPLAAGSAYALSRAGRVPEPYRRIADEVVARFLDVSIRDAEAVRARLLRDPIYQVLVEDPAFLAGGRILDLGCGRGLAAGLGAVAPGARQEGRSYLGVDVVDRYVRVAREALGDLPSTRFTTADLRDFDPPAADLVLLLSVLRYLPHPSQDALLRRLARALQPGARMLVRELDASAGWRFRGAALFDQLASLLPGKPRRRFGYRRAQDLRNALAAAGFEVHDRSTIHGAKRARVLFEAVRRPAPSA
jgi:uncharacterized protein (DUF2062 family)/2-polyprenyl-3-methyl-5-hydroxy-6-metoxy-1,4-benzoquinol methylase